MSEHINLDVIRRLNEGDWKEVCKEIDARISAAEKELRSCKPERLVPLQEKIKAYEELKLLPEQILEREE